MVIRISPTLIVFGVINIIVAVVPPAASSIGAFYVFARPPIPFKGVDLGAPLWQHCDKELPALKAEAVGSIACNGFLALLLIAGAFGLFIGQEWARWLTIGAAVLMILTLCIHDFYQLVIVQPEMLAAMDRHLPPGPPGEAEGAKIGLSGSLFLWSWTNPIFMLYLVAMCVTLMMHRAFAATSAKDKDKPLERKRRYIDRDHDDDGYGRRGD